MKHLFQVALGFALAFLCVCLIALIYALFNQADAATVGAISGIQLTDDKDGCPQYHLRAYDEERKRGCWTVPRTGPRTLVIKWEDGRITYISEMQFELYGEAY